MDKKVNLNDIDMTVEIEDLLEGIKKMVNNLDSEDLEKIGFNVQSANGVASFNVNFAIGNSPIDGINFKIESGDKINLGNMLQEIRKVINGLSTKK